MEEGPEASATEPTAPDQSIPKETTQLTPVRSEGHPEIKEVPSETAHAEAEVKKEEPQEGEPSKPLDKESESSTKNQESSDTNDKTNKSGNPVHGRRKRRRNGWTSKPKKPERDEGTPLSAMLSGKAPVTYPLKINSWFEIVNLGEVLPDKSKAIITPWVGPRSRGKKLLWPDGFEARRKTVSYVYPGTFTTYKCSVRTVPSESGPDVPEYTISTDEDPSNPIVRNDPEEALKELKARFQNMGPSLIKNFHFNEADAFFGVSNTNVQTFIKRLPNYLDVFQEYADDGSNGNDGEEEKEEEEEGEAGQNGAEEREQKKEFDFLFSDYRRGRGRVYYGEDIISFEDDFNEVASDNEGDDDEDDAYVPNGKRPKSSASSSHGTRSQKKVIPKKEKENEKEKRKEKGKEKKEKEKEMEMEIEKDGEKENVPAPIEVDHEKDKSPQNAPSKRGRKKLADKADSYEPRRKVPELKWGEAYPEFGIIYLPSKLPNYGIERLIEINEKQNKQIRDLNSEIARTMQAISKLRSASDDWLSLERSRINDIIDFDDGEVTK